jgi:DnaJ-class molecular chaperone
VPKDAGDNDIKKAYKRAALKYHPDKWGNASEEEQAEVLNPKPYSLNLGPKP